MRTANNCRLWGLSPPGSVKSMLFRGFKAHEMIAPPLEKKELKPLLMDKALEKNHSVIN